MDDHETRIQALEQARKKLEDALIVTAHRKQEEHGRTLDERIDELVTP